MYLRRHGSTGGATATTIIMWCQNRVLTSMPLLHPEPENGRGRAFRLLPPSRLHLIHDHYSGLSLRSSPKPDYSRLADELSPFELAVLD